MPTDKDTVDPTEKYFEELRETFSHRLARPLKYDPYMKERIPEILQQLLDYEEKSHPTVASEPSDKETDSIMVLRLLSQLVDLVGGWAMDHRAGMIVDEATPFPWPEDDDKPKVLADTHGHEASGSAYFKRQHDRSPELDRQILAEISGRACVIPERQQRDLSKALLSLSYNKIDPLLKPTKIPGQQSLERWRLRLRAVEYGYFMAGYTGNALESEFHSIDEKYNVRLGSTHEWNFGKQNLPKHIGDNRLRYRRQRARRAGERVKKIYEDANASEEFKQLADAEYQGFGPDAQVASGKRFQSKS